MKSDFKTLSDALQSGDVTAAQQAFAQLQKDLPAKGSSTTDSSNDPMQTLASALQKGDLTGAQQALASLQKAHHGHHGGHRPPQVDDTTSTSTDTDPDATSGTVLNTTA